MTVRDPLAAKIEEYKDEIWGFWERGPNGLPSFVELPKRPLVEAGLRPPIVVELPNGTLRTIIFKVKGADNV
jgi:hypothetical protein